jgi:small-conductance mechanosensitive channel
MTSNEKPQRERVVLAHRRGARMVRTRVEVQEQTMVGDALVRGLVRAQLGLALRLAAVVVCAVVAIPLLNAAFPNIAALTVVGIRLNWLVLAVLVYPLLYGVGRLYVRLAEQAERDFVGVVDSEP